MTRTLAGPRTLADVHANLVPNGGFESAPATLTAQTQTNNRWVDGTSAGSTAALGRVWGLILGGSAGRASFDNTEFHSGVCSLKLSTTTTGATAVVASYKTSTPLARELFALQPSTTYRITGWIKTNNVATNSAFIDFREYNSSISTLSTTSSSKLSGTNGWTRVSFTVTTGATAAYGSILLRLNVTGNVSDGWFDDITVTPVSPSRLLANTRTLA